MTDFARNLAYTPCTPPYAPPVQTRSRFALVLPGCALMALPAAAQGIPPDWAAHRIFADYEMCRDIILTANPVAAPGAVTAMEAEVRGGNIAMDVSLNTATEGGLGSVDYGFDEVEGLRMRCEVFAPLAEATADETRALVEARYDDLAAAPNVISHESTGGNFQSVTCIEPTDQGDTRQTRMRAAIRVAVTSSGQPGYLIEIEGSYPEEALACSEPIQ